MVDLEQKLGDADVIELAPALADKYFETTAERLMLGLYAYSKAIIPTIIAVGKLTNLFSDYLDGYHPTAPESIVDYGLITAGFVLTALIEPIFKNRANRIMFPNQYPIQYENYKLIDFDLEKEKRQNN